MKTLRRDSRGPLVRTLQEKLTTAWYPIQPTTEYFGAITDQAVRNFQRKNKLLADGVVGSKTWQVLGITESAKPDKKPLKLTKSVVPSLGPLSDHLASKAKNASKNFDVSKPVAQLNTSEKGLKFIYTREAMKNVSNFLHWPGGSSGVTLGPGYDLKERTARVIISDMIRIGLDADKAKKIAKGAGLQGDAAKRFCKTNTNLVVLSNKDEFQLLKIVVPRYENLARKKITANLLQNEFDSLVSFAYNLGEVWTTIADHINKGNINDAMSRMKEANKSGGEVNNGLVKRRELEIALFTFAEYGVLREV